MFLFLYPKKPVAKPSLSNPSLPYKMGKEKSVRNDNKEEQKLQKILQKTYFYYSQKTNQLSSIEACFYNWKEATALKSFLRILMLFLDKDKVIDN